MRGQRNELLKWVECDPQSGGQCQECSGNIEGLHRAVRGDVTVKARDNHTVGGLDWEQVPRGSQEAGQGCWRPFPLSQGQFVHVPLVWKSNVMSTKLLLSASAVLRSLPFPGSCVCTGRQLQLQVRVEFCCLRSGSHHWPPPKQQLPGKRHPERECLG